MSERYDRWVHGTLTAEDAEYLQHRIDQDRRFHGVKKEIAEGEEYIIKGHTFKWETTKTGGVNIIIVQADETTFTASKL